MYGKQYKLVKSFGSMYIKLSVCDALIVSEDGDKVDYTIIDIEDNQPSPIIYANSSYAKAIRNRAYDILKDLENKGFIKEI